MFWVRCSVLPRAFRSYCVAASGRNNRTPKCADTLQYMIVTAESPSQILDLVSNACEEKVSIDHVNLVTALHRIAKLAVEPVDDPFEPTPTPPEWLSSNPKLNFLLRMTDTALKQSLSLRDEKHFTNALISRSFNGGELSQVAWALAHLHPVLGNRCKPVLVKVRDSSMNLLKSERDYSRTAVPLPLSFTPTELTNVLWAFARVGVGPGRVKAQLEFGPGPRASAELKKTHHPSYATTLFQEAAAFAVKNFKLYNAHDVAVTLWALVNAEVRRKDLFELCKSQVVRSPGKFHPRGLVKILWSFAKISDQDLQPLFVSVGDHLCQGERFLELTFGERAMLVWSFAKVRVPHDQLFALVARELLIIHPNNRLAEVLDPLDFVNTCWAFGRAKMPTTTVPLRDVSKYKPAHKVKGRVPKKQKQTIDVDGRILLTHLAPAVVRLIPKLRPGELSQIVWAFASVECRQAVLFDAISRNLLMNMRVAKHNNQTICNVLWGFARAKVRARDLFEAYGEMVLSSNRLKSFTPQGVGDMLWAFARSVRETRGLPFLQKLLTAIEREFRGSLASFRGEDLANLFYGFHKLGYNSDLLNSQVCRAATLNASEYPAWALVELVALLPQSKVKENRSKEFGIYLGKFLSLADEILFEKREELSVEDVLVVQRTLSKEGRNVQKWVEFNTRRRTRVYPDPSKVPKARESE
eukprot:c17243_g1_i1.p1 GENE.c17243_g1_i1~~c17243_g1_i1.p1  ORF type:complete len:696 (+),score=136.92 c17243_g1_i1:34-2121(+)